MHNHYNIKLVGTVQGVFFRKAAKEKADELGIKGFVQNEPDGSVYIKAEGDPDRLGDFVDWCHVGPEGADVVHVEMWPGNFRNFEDFRIN